MTLLKTFEALRLIEKEVVWKVEVGKEIWKTFEEMSRQRDYLL